MIGNGTIEFRLIRFFFFWKTFFVSPWPWWNIRFFSFASLPPKLRRRGRRSFRPWNGIGGADQRFFLRPPSKNLGFRFVRQKKAKKKTKKKWNKATNSFKERGMDSSRDAGTRRILQRSTQNAAGKRCQGCPRWCSIVAGPCRRFSGGDSGDSWLARPMEWMLQRCWPKIPGMPDALEILGSGYGWEASLEASTSSEMMLDRYRQRIPGMPDAHPKMLEILDPGYGWEASL